MAIGIDGRSCSRPTARTGIRSRPPARSSRRSGRRRRRAAPFDLILFGNEAADTGDFQVGIRVATALGRPVVNGIKEIAAADGARSWRGARRPAAAGRSSTLPLPAVLGVKEGLNLPRYPSVPGRLRAKKKEIRADRRRRGRPRRARRRTRLATAARGPRAPVEVIGQGAGGGAGGRRAAAGARGAGPMTVLVARRARDGRAGSAVARGAGLARPRRSASRSRRSCVGSAGDRARPGGSAVTASALAHVVDDERLDGFAPAAWAAAIRAAHRPRGPQRSSSPRAATAATR